MTVLSEDEDMLMEELMPLKPHAFHLNLPAHHISEDDGVPYITKFAQDKARNILKLAHSIQLKESLYINNEAGDADAMEEEDEEDDDDHAFTDEYTLVSLVGAYLLRHDPYSTYYTCVCCSFHHACIQKLDLTQFLCLSFVLRSTPFLLDP
jgi:hypothetical protein